MKNLTPNQTEIIRSIEAEFSKINEVETSTDILSLIDNAIYEKHNLRKELEILDKINFENIRTIKNEIMSTLETICNKYGFSLECRIMADKDYCIEMIFNGYYHENYPSSLRRIEAIIEHPIKYKDSIRHIGSPTPNFKGFGNLKKYENKEEFIKLFVDETIKVLKSKI